MRLLVVCLGNICRSPMAEGALRAQIERKGLRDVIEVDSAGTGNWHAGEPPDPRAIGCARGHGVDIAGLRARQVRSTDFDQFDWILCADASNQHEVLQRAPAHARAKVALWLPWAGIDARQEIPDPYTGDAAGFEEVWTLAEAAAVASVRRLTAKA